MGRERASTPDTANKIRIVLVIVVLTAAGELLVPSVIVIVLRRGPEVQVAMTFATGVSLLNPPIAQQTQLQLAAIQVGV